MMFLTLFRVKMLYQHQLSAIPLIIPYAREHCRPENGVLGTGRPTGKLRCCLVVPSMHQDYYNEQSRQKSCPPAAYTLGGRGHRSQGGNNK